MPRTSLIAALALVVCLSAQSAFAQNDAPPPPTDGGATDAAPAADPPAAPATPAGEPIPVMTATPSPNCAVPVGCGDVCAEPCPAPPCATEPACAPSCAPEGCCDDKPCAAGDGCAASPCEEGCATDVCKPKYRPLFGGLKPLLRGRLSNCGIGQSCDTGGCPSGCLSGGLGSCLKGDCNGFGACLGKGGFGSCLKGSCFGGGCMSGGCFGNGLFGNGCFGNGCFGNGCFGNGCFGNGCFGNGCMNGICAGNGCYGSNCYGGACQPAGRVCMKGYPDSRWSPPTHAPVIRNPAQYRYWWPQGWYGSGNTGAVAAPMVSVPTDTTQLGFSYMQVPTWRRTRCSYPPIPDAGRYHNRVAPAPAPYGYPRIYQPIAVPHHFSGGPTLPHHGIVAVPQSSTPQPQVQQAQPKQQQPQPQQQAQRPRQKRRSLSSLLPWNKTRPVSYRSPR